MNVSILNFALYLSAKHKYNKNYSYINNSVKFE